MTDLAERTKRIANRERQRFDSTMVAREWWTVTKPNLDPIEVFVWPAQTQAEMLRLYPQAGVLPSAP